MSLFPQELSGPTACCKDQFNHIFQLQHFTTELLHSGVLTIEFEFIEFIGSSQRLIPKAKLIAADWEEHENQQHYIV
jgi:hypothetical protein